MGCRKLTYYPDTELKTVNEKKELTLKISSQKSCSVYLFGFNGQEKDDEVAGAGNTNTAEFWEYDTRLGRRWNIDPHDKRYPFQSSYLAFNNCPLLFKDPNGKDGVAEVNVKDKTITVTARFFYDKSNTDFKSYGITEDIPGQKSMITLDENGWSSQVRKFSDQDGVVWTVTFNIEFIGKDSQAEVDKELNDDKTANRLTLRTSWTDADGNMNEGGHWNSKSRTMELYTIGRPDGSTVTHELGHALGLPEEVFNYFSPNFFKDDSPKSNLKFMDEAGIMSYAKSRQIKDYDLKLMLNSAACIAKAQQENVVKIHIRGNFGNNTFSIIK